MRKFSIRCSQRQIQEGTVDAPLPSPNLYTVFGIILCQIKCYYRPVGLAHPLANPRSATGSVLCEINQPTCEYIIHNIFISYYSSLQVMIQPHNRTMSFSLYIAALAVSDSVVLSGGLYICFLKTISGTNYLTLITIYSD